MDIPDSVIGKIVLISTTTLFVVSSIWINTYPFFDEDSSIYPLLPDPQWLLLFFAVWGFLFIGGLMSFTLYHIRQYL